MRNPIRSNIMLNDQPLYQAEAAYYRNYLNRNKELLDYTLENWGRVLIIRFDLRFPEFFPTEFTSDNTAFTSFIKDYRAALSKNHIRMEYVARREQVTSAVPHYHAAVFLDGNRARKGYYYQELTTTIWLKRLAPYSNVSRGLVHYAGEHLIDRYRNSDTQSQYAEACRMLSYLAKHNEQDITHSKQRKIFYSLFG